MHVKQEKEDYQEYPLNDLNDPNSSEDRLKLDGITYNKVFDSGAVRGLEDSIARFDLISPIALRRIAETYGEGAIKYSDDNWLKGIDAKNLMNHAMVHINKYMLGDKSEDHLAHATWNLMAIMHFEETRLDLINITSRIKNAVP